MTKKTVLTDINSILYRKLIAEVLQSLDITHIVIGEAQSVSKSDFFVAIVDGEMYCEDNFARYDTLKGQYPSLPVIMLFNTKANVQTLLREARKRGVLYFLEKPLDQSYEKNKTIISRALKTYLHDLETTKGAKEGMGRLNTPIQSEGGGLLLIAASTGGPRVIEEVLCALPLLSIPIIVVQHMPENFTDSFAKNLDLKCAFDVVEGKNAEYLTDNTAYIAPGGKNIFITERKQILLNEKELVNGVRPCADLLFTSCAKAYRGQNVIAVVLTGMGSDGAKGVLALKENCNCYCITQNEKSCTVYGMPRAVEEMGLSDAVLDKEEIAKCIVKKVMGRG